MLLMERFAIETISLMYTDEDELLGVSLFNIKQFKRASGVRLNDERHWNARIKRKNVEVVIAIMKLFIESFVTFPMK